MTDRQTAEEIAAKLPNTAFLATTRPALADYIYEALTRARSEGREEAARFADEQAAAIERAAYPQGALSAEWPEAMKWRKIASAIRSLAEKEKNDG